MSIGASPEQIAKALGQQSRSGDTYKCRCPAHEDKQASLTINVRGNGDGRPTVHCFAGCLPKQIYEAIESATGMHFEARELPSNRTQDKEPTIYPAPIAWSPILINGKAPTTAWPYHNTSGQLMFVVARYDTPTGKDIKPFSVVNRNNNMVWKSKLTLQNRPLFNTKELVARPDAPVLYVEGEKAASAAMLMDEFADYVVTTNSGGVLAWKKTDMSLLKGRRIFLWPDNDQAGQDGFTSLGRFFNVDGFSQEVRIAYIPPSFPQKWDLADEWPPGASVASVTWYNAPHPDRTFTLKSITRANYVEAFDAMYTVLNDGTKLYTVSKEFVKYRRGNRINPDAPSLRATLNVNHEAYNCCFIEGQSALRLWANDKMAENAHVHGFGWDPSIDEHVIEHGGVKLVNGFNGWTFEPNMTASCELFKTYMLELICSNDKNAYDYIWNFLAHMIQYPAEKPTVAILLKGNKGVGKSFFFNMLTKLLGGIDGYGCILNTSGALGDPFNAHFGLGRLAVFVNEWEITTSRTLENTVKSFITEDRIHINIKYIPNFVAPNYARIFGATNHNHVWNATSEERRITILDVADTHIQDRKYFDAIENELMRGGFGRLMYELSKAEVDKLVVTRPMVTQALNIQKEFSKPPSQAFAYDMLRRGEIFLKTWHGGDQRDIHEFYQVDNTKWSIGSIGLPSALVSEIINRDYYSKGERYKENHMTLSKAISVSGVLAILLGEELARTSVIITSNGLKKAVAGYKLPSLEVCRQKYADYVKLPYEQLFMRDEFDPKNVVQFQAPATEAPF